MKRIIGPVFVLVLACAVLASGCIYLSDSSNTGLTPLRQANESYANYSNDTTLVNDTARPNDTAGTNGTLATNLTGTTNALATNAPLVGTYRMGDIVEYLGVKGKISIGEIVNGKVPDYLQINDETGALLVYASANTTYGPTAVVHYPRRGTGEGEADIYVKGELIATMRYSKDASFNGYATMACEPDKYPDFTKNFTIKRLRDCP